MAVEFRSHTSKIHNELVVVGGVLVVVVVDIGWHYIWPQYTYAYAINSAKSLNI